MRRFVVLHAFLCAIVLWFSASPVMAQSLLWVGPNGNDNNACTQTSPCGTFQGALNKGNVFQISCLGSGNYGPISITNTSLTLDCGDGNVGNIFGFTTAGIDVSSLGGSVTVILRHLALNGLGGLGGSGIDASQFFGGTLIIEDCIIHGYHNGDGINFQPQSARGLLQVSNTQIFDSADGIVVSPARGQIASVTLINVELTGNSQNGLVLGGAGVVAGTMRNSVASSNTTDGVLANAGQVFFTVESSSLITNLANGVRTNSAGSNLNLTASTISGNGTGVLASAGSLVSFSNNTLNGNAVDGTFTSTTALK